MANQNNTTKSAPDNRFLQNPNNTLDQMDNSLHGNAMQTAQANHDARHLYASLLKNSDISGWSLATDPSYQRLASLVYDSEPVEPWAELKGLGKEAIRTPYILAAGLVNAAQNPGQTLNAIEESISSAAENPAQALENFILGSQPERERLADIMLIDDAAQRIEAHSRYYTEFWANRSIALSATISGGKAITQAANTGIKHLGEAAIAAGDNGFPPFSGAAPVTAGANYSALALEQVAADAGAASHAPWLIGGMAMSAGNHNQQTASSNQHSPIAQHATEEYIILGRLKLTLDRIRHAENVSAESKRIADALIPIIDDATRETRATMVIYQHIPEGGIANTIREANLRVLRPDVAIPIAAEERVIRAIMNSVQARADFPANIANVMEQTLQLQLSSVRVRDYASTATPGAVEIESSYFIDHQAGPSP
jgi:hypothetical protein